jgi:tRNA 2-selenouridine synthase
MSLSLPLAQFLEASTRLPVIDVRSPAEFEKGHIPGAFNIPLFSNEERARIGTAYKQQGKDTAVLIGLELVGPKLAAFVKEASVLTREKKVLVHCWRGGMRSSSFAWLLNTAGIQAITLKGGYKAYRHAVQKNFEVPLQLIVLGGETGSGKTDILKQIALQGEQMIDLEGLAHHKGSSFGALGQLPQPSSEEFENRLNEVLKKLDPTKRIWLEDESHTIGRVFIPDAFWFQMKKAPLIRMALPKHHRIERLIIEYGKFSVEELEAAVLRIQKRLGGQATKQCQEALAAGDLRTVVDLTLTYYDKAYNHLTETRKKENLNSALLFIHIEENDPRSGAGQIIALANQQITAYGNI